MMAVRSDLLNNLGNWAKLVILGTNDERGQKYPLSHLSNRFFFFSMKLYPNLFAYLNDAPVASLDLPVKAKNRPVVIDDGKSHRVVGLIHRSAQVYEIGFPYLLPEDIDSHATPGDALVKKWQLSLHSQDSSSLGRLLVADEVFDGAALEEEKQWQESWNQKLGDRLDEGVSLMLKTLVGLFNSLGQNCTSHLTSHQFDIDLSQLNQHLDNIDIREATLPLVVSLNRRYNLHKKLQKITPNLRHQLRRRTETMRVSDIQEMDAYSMRDYIRRPGRSAAEKAGVKQELTGVNRYADYNTAENKFLLYFAGRLLHGECDRYEKSNAQQYRSEVVQLRALIARLKQQCRQENTRVFTEKTYQFTQPNHVLLKDPIYRSFYKAYLDYISHKQEKEQVWPFRNQILADAFYLFMTAALLRFPENQIDSTVIACRRNPDLGHYLILDKSVPNIRAAIDHQPYLIRLHRPEKNHPQCDWMLTVKSAKDTAEFGKFHLPIWVFWYAPDESAIAHAEKYLNQFNDSSIGLIFYLQRTAKKYSAKGDVGYSPTGKIWMFQLPAAIESFGFSTSVDFLTEFLQRLLFLSMR